LLKANRLSDILDQLRERFGFEGTPIRLKVRRRARKGRED